MAIIELQKSQDTRYTIARSNAASHRTRREVDEAELRRLAIEYPEYQFPTWEIFFQDEAIRIHDFITYILDYEHLSTALVFDAAAIAATPADNMLSISLRQVFLEHKVTLKSFADHYIAHESGRGISLVRIILSLKRAIRCLRDNSEDTDLPQFRRLLHMGLGLRVVSLQAITAPVTLDEDVDGYM